jgi:hypothetical protein
MLLLTGVRGVGKTVALAEIARMAAERGFVVCRVTFDAYSDNPRLLAARVAEAVAPLRGKQTNAWRALTARLSALSIEVNAAVIKLTSVPPSSPGQSETVARQVMTEVLAETTRLASESGGKGLALFIDEIQEAPGEQLGVVCNALQDVLTASPGTPFASFGAGLPNAPEHIMEAASFTERMDFQRLGPLDATDAYRALLEPSMSMGVTWDVEAVEIVLDEAAGSPFLIQSLGNETWLVADPQPGGVITATAAQSAVGLIRDSLAQGMFRGRWTKLPAHEQAMLVALAAVSRNPAQVARYADMVRALGKDSPQQLTKPRKSLIDKGIIEAAGHGLLRFTMPGFSAFVLEQAGLPTELLEGRPMETRSLTARPEDTQDMVA